MSPISEIRDDTFNTGQNKFVAQFSLLRKNVAIYLQRTIVDKGYLVALTVCTRVEQVIGLPPLVDPTSPTKGNDEDMRKEVVKSVAK